MSKYNFQVNANITVFIQRECEDDDEAERIKAEIEDREDWELSEIIPHTEVDIENSEVIVYGRNEE